MGYRGNYLCRNASVFDKKCFDRTWFNQWNYWYYSSDSTSIEQVEDTLGVQALSYLPQYVVLECNDLLMNPLNGLIQNNVPIFPVDGVFSIRKTATHERLTISRK